MSGRRRAAIVIFVVVTGAFLVAFGLTVGLAMLDQEVRGLADVFALQNVPALVIYTVAIASLLLMILAMPLAFVTYRMTLPDQRRAAGRCVGCGYPLDDAARCPECGRSRNA